MKTTCLINNYNYARFVGEAIDSALSQTVPFDEIVVVDDGSTDGSIGLLETRYGRHERVRIVKKSNDGQLSCFNEGLRHSSGDVICFLDADDVYEDRYLERLLPYYTASPRFDFIFVDYRRFPPLTEPESMTIRGGPGARDLGYSVASAYCMEAWIGAPTSCISSRRELLDRFMPIPYLADWRTRADDCLVFGSSLAGGRKCHLQESLVRYRIHGDNHFSGRRAGRDEVFRRGLAINRLFQWVTQRMGLDPERVAALAEVEFRTLERPSYEQAWDYVRLVRRSPIRWSRKIRMFRGILEHYWNPPVSDLTAVKTTDVGHRRQAA